MCRLRNSIAAAGARLALVLAVTLIAGIPATASFALPPALPGVATFSIVACDTLRGEWGVAVASRFLAVGSVVPWARAGVGAIATQAVANTDFGPLALESLQKGYTAIETLDRLIDGDPQRATRQVGVVDAGGASATFTGERCESWAGGLHGPGFAIQGNILGGPDVADAMAKAFQITEGSLPERLLAALVAGEAAGGDRRGKQSAALLVVKARGGYQGGNDRYVDLRVDDAEDPIAELARLYSLHARTFLPDVHARLGDEALAAGDRARADREYARVVDLYRNAIDESPRDPDPRNGLAWFYAERRVNLDEAYRLAQEALSLRPNSWQVLDTLAEIQFARGDAGKALDLAQKALGLDPQNVYLKRQEERFRSAAQAGGKP
jgi:uncharacterized Ntn-hydrolase superfamily protein